MKLTDYSFTRIIVIATILGLLPINRMFSQNISRKIVGDTYWSYTEAEESGAYLIGESVGVITYDGEVEEDRVRFLVLISEEALRFSIAKYPQLENITGCLGVKFEPTHSFKGYYWLDRNPERENRRNRLVFHGSDQGCLAILDKDVRLKLFREVMQGSQLYLNIYLTIEGKECLFISEIEFNQEIRDTIKKILGFDYP